MRLPFRRARGFLLAGGAALMVSAPASANVTSVYSTDPDATLTVDVDRGDRVEVVCDSGLVKVNGADPVREPTPGTTTGCAGPHAVVIQEAAGSTGDNSIDLQGVTRARFPNLSDNAVTISATGGDDTIIGSELADVASGGAGDDRIVAAEGDDTMNGQAGDDTLVWNPGEGSDVMSGGDGVDTVESNGSGSGETADETYTARTVSDGVRFSRTSAGPFSLLVTSAEKYVNRMRGGDDSFRALNALSGIAITLSGGSGDDDLRGTDETDVLKGDAGDDTLAGEAGNDTLKGGTDDDLMIWSPGDGSDRIEGGRGRDTAQDNDGGKGGHFVVTPNGPRVTATRDTGAPFFLDLGSTERLDLNLRGGADSVDINPGLASLIKIHIDAGAGDDLINASDGARQSIDGGIGTDRARVDRNDNVVGVERVFDGFDRAPRGSR